MGCFGYQQLRIGEPLRLWVGPDIFGQLLGRRV